jgi:MbtH protein
MWRVARACSSVAPGSRRGRRDGCRDFPDATEDTRTCIVLVNHEEQCSLWLADREIPVGWSAVGEPGSREECPAYVREVWTGVTPPGLQGASRRPGPDRPGLAPGRRRFDERVLRVSQAGLCVSRARPWRNGRVPTRRAWPTAPCRAEDTRSRRDLVLGARTCSRASQPVSRRTACRRSCTPW